MKQDEIKTKVFEALGQASMCWSETPKGVFDSELALKIGNELMEYLLSKKPSVSDEEIKNKAEETYKHSIIEERAFQNGAKWALSLSPQVVQSEVSERFNSDIFIENVCLSFRHDFGLMAEQDKQRLRFECSEWMRAISNNWNHFKSLTPPDAEKWISVEEKPKEDIHCLVFLYNPNTNDSWQETAYFMDGYFYQTMGKQEYITHWMPLPKPPINN